MNPTHPHTRLIPRIKWDKMNRENYLCFELQIGENEDIKLILLKTEYSVIGKILIDVGVYSF
jgi:hypothetical protein